MKRRSFLATTATVATPGFMPLQPQKRRVAVIGHTGRGNYGHGLDTVWQHLPETELVAVADADPTGLDKAMQRLQVEHGYTSYRKMLVDQRPEFVSIAPRHADQHLDMSLAAMEAGVKGLYIEKPFCRTPAEADALIEAAEQHQVTIAVAHRNRYHPVLQKIDQIIAGGDLGKLLELRGRGKGDRRGGGEDLWVLGSHIMNLIHYFTGRATHCSAIMLQDGKRVTAEHVHAGAEGLGPLAANEVHARYQTERGPIAYYDSIANDGTRGKAYCLELVGSQGTVVLHIDRDPVAHFVPGCPFDPSLSPREWIPITTQGVGHPENAPVEVAQVHNHVIAVRDLINASDQGRQPLCGAHAAAMTVEMICAVFESHRQHGQSVALPLNVRGNALEQLTRS